MLSGSARLSRGRRRLPCIQLVAPGRGLSLGKRLASQRETLGQDLRKKPHALCSWPLSILASSGHIELLSIVL